MVFVGFAVKPLILERPSFFLQVRNNGATRFLIPLILVAKSQKLSLMEVNNDSIEKIFTHICV